jgi:hypothetical protein
MHLITALLETSAEFGYRLERERLLYHDSTGVFVHFLRDGRPALVLRHDSLAAGVQRALAVPDQRLRERAQLRHPPVNEQRVVAREW